MRKQLSYNDDLSLLGQRVRPILPRTTVSTLGERYRLYSPTSDGAHRHQKSSERATDDITFASVKRVCKKVTTTKPPPGSKAVYQVKINNLDSDVIPVANEQLLRINNAHSVADLQKLLTSVTSSSPAVRQPPASTSFTVARTRCVQVYKRCFLHHCTTLRDALGD